MIAFYFGPPDRRLFGSYHPPTSGGSDGLAVLLCNPFGHEAIRTHRLFRVLAERLAGKGMHVLRFDYFGTGDSAGDDDESDLDGWCKDTLAAHEELARRSMPARVVWMGARLGSVAALKAAKAPVPCLQRLVLWDPIIDGRDYLQFLRVKHVEAIETSYSLPVPAWRARLDVRRFPDVDEAIGFALSPAMRAQLRSTETGSLDMPPGIETRVIADPGDVTVQPWVLAQSVGRSDIRLIALPQALEWTSDDSLNTALVPGPALQSLMLAIDD